MNMRKLPFGKLFTSASAEDKKISAMWQRKFLVGVFCNLTINLEAPAKYLDDMLEITASMLLTASSPRQKSSRGRHQPQESTGRTFLQSCT
jgi:hypothetical protein